MIKIETLKAADRDREVKYTASHGDIEYGRISSWNEWFIFVRYHLKIYADGKQAARSGVQSEATRPEDLEFIGAK